MRAKLASSLGWKSGSLFAFASLVEFEAVEDTPDPSYNKDGSKTLGTAYHEGGHVAALFVEEGSNKGTESWGNDVQDEADECNGLGNISPGPFAAWEVVVLFGHVGVAHSFSVFIK